MYSVPMHSSSLPSLWEVTADISISCCLGWYTTWQYNVTPCLQDKNSCHFYLQLAQWSNLQNWQCRCSQRNYFGKFKMMRIAQRCITFSRVRKCALLEAVIGVKCPLAPAGRGLGIQPVGREHHEDEMGVELLLLFFHTAHGVVFCFHTCRSKSVSLEDIQK